MVDSLYTYVHVGLLIGDNGPSVITRNQLWRIMAGNKSSKIDFSGPHLSDQYMSWLEQHMLNPFYDPPTC